MTRLWTEGFEMGDDKFWDVIDLSGVTSSQHRTGNYSYQITGSGDNCTKNLADISEFYLRIGVWIDTGGTYNLVRWRHGTTILGGVYINMANPGLRVDITVNDAIVATGTNNLLSAGWNLIEVHVKIDDSGQIQTKVNGIADITYNGDTKPGADTHADNLYFACQGGHYQYVDDLAMNNTSGISDNSWCGDGHIEVLMPNADGDTLQWTPSTGTTHYTLVDEIPPVSTDYVTSASSGYQDMYQLSNITSGKSIKRIWAESRAKDNQSTGAYMKLGFKTSASVVLSSGSRQLLGNFSRVIGDEATTNPVNGLPWTDTDLNGLQVVIESE